MSRKGKGNTWERMEPKEEMKKKACADGCPREKTLVDPEELDQREGEGEILISEKNRFERKTTEIGVWGLGLYMYKKRRGNGPSKVATLGGGKYF